MNSLDVCLGCGNRVRDFEEGGFEAENGQRGHFACTPVLDSNVEPSAVHSGPRAGIAVGESSESVSDMTIEARS